MKGGLIMPEKYMITSNGSFVRCDELYHWGVKGMKWGVRKYQNADGSLTNAGKSRYSSKAEAKEAYRQAKKSSYDKYNTATRYGMGRLTITNRQRKDYSKDAQAYNNTLAKRIEAKYDYKATKAQLKGNNDRVAKLRAKQELKVKQQKKRTNIANAYLKDTYEKQSVGRQIVRSIIGGNKGTVNALVKAGYSERGAKVMSRIFTDSTNLMLAFNKSDRSIKEQMKNQN